MMYTHDRATRQAYRQHCSFGSAASNNKVRVHSWVTKDALGETEDVTFVFLTSTGRRYDLAPEINFYYLPLPVHLLKEQRWRGGDDDGAEGGSRMFTCIEMFAPFRKREKKWCCRCWGCVCVWTLVYVYVCVCMHMCVCVEAFRGFDLREVHS